MAKSTVIVLNRWIEEQGRQPSKFLFPNTRGERLSADAVQHMVAKHVVAARQVCPSLAKKRVTPRKPQARRRRESPDATINTLVILVVIVMVLGGLFLYAQDNKKQAAQWQAILQAIAAIPAPTPTALPDEPQAIESAASIDAAKDPLKPAAAMAVVRPPSSNE